MDKQIEFTREELYRIVWERPVLVIAKEVGVSDVAVAKACRKAGIPLPSRGHWASAKAGRAVNMPPLPKAKSDQPASVLFNVLENPPPKSPKPEILVGPLVEIPSELFKPHRLVAELKGAAKGQAEDKGIIPLNYHRFLRVRTSAIQFERALILMDTLIKQLEARGCKVRVSEKSAETELVLKEGVVTFRLDERTKQTAPPPPPPRPPGRRGEHYYEPWRPAHVLVGTGELTLLFGKYRIRNSPNTWKDRANRPLEMQLHEVIAAIPLWEAELLAERLETEDRAARAREAEKRRIASARAEETLRLQRLKLINQLLAWERAERLRGFIAAFEQTGDRSPEAMAWLGWANLQAQELDPICSNPKAITDPGVVLGEHFTGRGSWEKQPRDWWYFDPKEQPALESRNEFEHELERDDASEAELPTHFEDREAKPAPRSVVHPPASIGGGGEPTLMGSLLAERGSHNALHFLVGSRPCERA